MNLSSILPAPQLSVVDQGGSYNSNPYAATVTINGVTGTNPSLEGVPVTLDYQVVNAVGTITADLGTQPPTLVGSYQVTALFTGSADYRSATTNPYPFKITRANPVLTVTDLGGTYTGSAYPAGVQVNGVTTTSLEGKPVTLDYHLLNPSGNPIADLGGQAPVQAGSYSVQASFAGSADYYTATSTLVDFTINPAAPVVSVTDPGGSYTGSSYPASIQINGVSATTLEGVPVTLDYQLLSAVGISPYDLGTQAPVQAGTYSVTASFAGSADYSAQTTTPYDFTISRVAPSVNVTDAGGVYTGEAYPGSVTINGVATDTLEGVPVSFTYYQGTTLLAAAPTDAGTYSVIASFGGSVDYSPITTAEVPFSILQAKPSVNVTSPDVIYDNLPYQAASATVTGVDGIAMDTLEGVPVSFTYYQGTTLLAAAPTAAGTYSVIATFAGSLDYAQATAKSTFQILQAKPGVSVTSGDVTYDNLPYQATATVTGVDGVALDTLEGVPLSFTYYQGTTLLSAAPTDAGTYSVIASFGGSVDYSPLTTSEVPFSILQAKPSVNITSGDVTFDNRPYQATATVTGVDGVAMNTLEGVSVSFTYYQGTTLLATAPTDAGTYSVTASFAGSSDYAQAAATTTFQILQATPNVSVTSPNVTYDNLPYQEASATVRGVDGVAMDTLEGVAVSFTYYQGTNLLSAAPTDAGMYSMVASFVGSPDYAPATATNIFQILQAKPSVHVTSGNVTFDNLPYQATATVTGVDGVALDTLEGVPLSFTYYQGTTLLSAAPTDAGTYSVIASFGGSVDYSPLTTSEVPFSILQATPSVNITSGDVTFDNLPYQATATVTGIDKVAMNTLEGVSVSFTYYQGTTLLSTEPTDAGTYSVIASFAGSQNYFSANTTSTFQITRATPSVSVTSPNVTFDNLPYQEVTATVTGITGVAMDTLESVPVSFTYYLGTTLLSTAPNDAGTYSVVASFAGSLDYFSATASSTFQILQAKPSVNVTSPNVTFDNLPYQEASATVTGVDGVAVNFLESVPVSFTYYHGTTLLSAAPTNAGTYSVTASFAGSPNYVQATATSTFQITQATPSVSVTSPDVTFNNLPYQATATVTGVDGDPMDTLQGVTLSFTYYQGTTLLSTAPTNAGSYSVCALYPGSQDYTDAAATVAFNISQEPTQVTVMDQGGTFNGSAFPATAVVSPTLVVVNPSSVTSSPSLARTEAISLSNPAQAVGLNTTDVLAATLDYQQLNADGSYTDLGNTAPIHPGIYQAIGSFGGSQNYSSATTSISFVIDQAVPTVAVRILQPTAKNAPVQVQVTLRGVVPGVDTSPSTRLEGVSPVLNFYASATAGAFPLASAPSQVGNYTVVIDYPGSQDYQPLTAADFFRINPIVASGSVASGSVPSGAVQNPTGTTPTNNIIVEPLLAILTNGPVITNLLFGNDTTTQVQQSVQAIVLVVITLPVNSYAVGFANEFAGGDPNALLVVNEEDPEIDVQLAGSAANGLIVPPLLTAQLLPGPGADEKEPSPDAGEAIGFLQRSTPRFNRKALQVTDSVFDGDDTVTLIEALTRGESVEPLAAPPDQPAPVADASKTEAEVIGSEEVSAPANGNRTLVVTLIVVVGAGLMLGAIVKLRLRWLRIG